MFVNSDHLLGARIGLLGEDPSRIRFICLSYDWCMRFAQFAVIHGATVTLRYSQVVHQNTAASWEIRATFKHPGRGIVRGVESVGQTRFMVRV